MISKYNTAKKILVPVLKWILMNTTHFSLSGPYTRKCFTAFLYRVSQKKVDPFKFKLAIILINLINLNVLIASN